MLGPPLIFHAPGVQGQLAVGGRVNAYVNTTHSYAPNLDIELYHYPLSGKLFMYLNLVPRRSLVSSRQCQLDSALRQPRFQ